MLWSTKFRPFVGQLHRLECRHSKTNKHTTRHIILKQRCKPRYSDAVESEAGKVEIGLLTRMLCLWMSSPNRVNRSQCLRVGCDLWGRCEINAWEKHQETGVLNYFPLCQLPLSPFPSTHQPDLIAFLCDSANKYLGVQVRRQLTEEQRGCL